MSRDQIRLGIVGCGAVVESLHLPASLSVPEVEVVALVDVDLERARQLAARFGVPGSEPDYGRLFGTVDAVLLATPPHLHARHSCEFLAAGIHVLCEKPISLTVDEAQTMVDTAASHGRCLAVGHHRRFHRNLSLLKVLVAGNALGSITDIVLEDGFEFVWPTQTAYMFDRSTMKGGVLMENGIHVLDTLLWLFGPVASVVDYGDDAIGGLESNVEARLKFESGAIAHIRISRTALLSNTMTVHGEDGWAEIALYEEDKLAYQGRDKLSKALGRVTLRPQRRPDGFGPMARQLTDFADSIQQGVLPRAPGAQALMAVELARRCYALAADRPLPESAPLPGVPR
jgi:predicted dehydrogenase